MSQAHKKVVLLVEDEPHILSLLSDYLAGEGYKVLEAADAPRAFEILATKPQLDLLVTDFRLPGGVSGVMIAEPALKLRPDLKIIFISGSAMAVVSLIVSQWIPPGTKTSRQPQRKRE